MQQIPRRLRPVRFATLVAPGDFRQLARAIELNTCLWGGMFNPIIPNYKVRPKGYSDGRFENPSAQEILLGHLETFEPDYIVAENHQAAESIPFPFSKRVVYQPGNKIFEPGGWYGLSIISLLGNVYDKQLHSGKSEKPAVSIAARAVSDTSLVTAATLGRFPRRAWGQVTQDVKELFLANEIDLNEEEALKHFFQQGTNLLWLGSSGLRYIQRQEIEATSLFYMDAGSFIDIVDYWNLRALGWKMVPLVMQWNDSAVKIANKFIAQSKTEQVQIMRGRSISEQDFESFHKQIKPGRKKFIVRSWHPRIWRKEYRDSDRAFRRDIQAAKDVVPRQPGTSTVTCSPLFPNWIRESDQFGFYYSHWVNVFSPKHDSDELDAATVMPYFSFAQSSYMSADKTSSWNNSEGFVVGCAGKTDALNLELPSHWDVFQKWFSDRKFTVARSAAGTNVLELTRASEGLSKAYYLASVEVLNTFHHLSKGNSLTYKQLVGRLKQAHSVGGDRHYPRILEFMTKAKSVRIGVELDCSSCGRKNWFALSGLAEVLTCDRCLRSFPFPADQPSKAHWSYRALGPFSMPDFAGGAYTVLLTARFFSWSIGDDISWYPGIELKRGKPNDLEIDLALWWKTTERLRDAEPAMVFAECKTFDKFEERDFKRAKELMRLFPGATFVFATLRRELTNREKRALRSIAVSGLRQWRKLDRPLRLIILTAHELLQNSKTPGCWQDIAGKQFKFIDTRYSWKMGHDKLQRISNVTQQLHLGVQDYYEFIDADSAKLAAKRSRKK